MMPVRRSPNWLPSLFNEFFGNEWMDKISPTSPAINVFETEKEYKVEVAAPGQKKEDFSIRLEENNQLVIALEKKEESNEEQKNGRYLRREFYYSRFQQNMLLPEDADTQKIEAKVEDGVLVINIPKREYKEEKKTSQTIEIK